MNSLFMANRYDESESETQVCQRLAPLTNQSVVSPVPSDGPRKRQTEDVSTVTSRDTLATLCSLSPHEEKYLEEFGDSHLSWLRIWGEDLPDAFSRAGVSSNIHSPGMFTTLFMRKIVDSIGELDITNPAWLTPVPEDLFCWKTCSMLFSLNVAVLLQKIGRDCHHRDFKSVFSFICTSLGLEADHDPSSFIIDGKWITPEQVSGYWPLSCWWYMRCRDPSDCVLFVKEIPLIDCLIYSLCLAVLTDEPDMKYLSIEPHSKPCTWDAVTDRMKSRIKHMYFSRCERGDLVYWVRTNAMEDGAVRYDSLTNLEYCVYSFKDEQNVIILPWDTKYSGIPSKDEKIIVPNFRRCRSGWAQLWPYMVVLIALALPVTEAVSEASAPPKPSGVMWGIFLTLALHLVFIVFPHLKPIAPPEEFDAESGGPDYGPNSYGTNWQYVRRPTKKQQDGDSIPLDTDKQLRSECSKRIELSSKRMSLVSRKWHLLRVKAIVAKNRITCAKSGEIDCPSMPDALVEEDRNNPGLRKWVIECVSKRLIPISWLPDTWLEDTRHYMTENASAIAAMNAVSSWKRAVSESINTVRTLSVPKVANAAPSFDSIAEYAAHPLTDVFLLVQRLICTNWASQPTNVAKASIALDVSVVLLRLWKIVPKTRTEWASCIFSMVVPGFSMQDPDKDNVKDSSWVQAMITFDGSWDSCKEISKKAITKLMALGATLPLLWSSFATKESWTEAFTDFCKRHKGGKSIESVVESMFDVFEMGAVMCGMGKRAACFNETLKPLEHRYTDLNGRLTEIFIGKSKETFVEVEPAFHDLLSDYEHMRETSVGLSEEAFITSRVSAIKSHLVRIHSAINGSGKHYETTFYAFSGAPGAGKTTTVECVHSSCFTAIKEKPRVGEVSEDDAYHSGLNPYQNAWNLDDSGKFTEKFVKTPAGGLVIAFGTNAPTPLLSPIAENKGWLSKHKLATFTGNELGCGLYRGISTPGAVKRRVREYWQEVVPERAIKVDGHYEPKPEWQRPIPEPLHCQFYRVNVEENDTGLNISKETEPMEWPEVIDEIRDKFVAHHRKQIALLGSHVDRSYCVHNMFKVNCKDCCHLTQQDFCQTIRKKAVAAVDNRIVDLVSSYFGHIVDLSEEEKINNKVNNFIMCCFFSVCLFYAFFISGNFIAATTCAIALSRCCLYTLVYSFAEVASHINTLTAGELHDMTVESPWSKTSPLIAGLTLTSVLGLAQMMRTLRQQDTGSDEIKQSTEDPKDQQDIGADEIKKPTTDPKEEPSESTDGAKQDKAPDPEVKELSDQLTAYRKQEIDFLTIADLKKQRAAANLVKEINENYWCKPNKAVPVSLSGSGTTDEQLAIAVSNTMYAACVTRGKKVIPRTCWNCRPNFVLMYKHGHDALNDGETITYTRNGYEKRVRLDKKSTRACPHKDYVLVYVGTLQNNPVDMTKYFSTGFSKANGIAGLIVYRKRGTYEFATDKCQLSIQPDRVVPVRGKDSVVDYKGVVTSSLNFRSYDGLCGAIYIANRTILGVHCYGDEGNWLSYMNTGGPLIDKSEVDSMLSGEYAVSNFIGPKMDYESAKVERCELHPKNPTNWVSTGSVEIWDSVERRATPRSQLIKNPHAKRYGELLNVELDGTFDKPRSSFNQSANKVLMTCAAHKGNPPRSHIKAATELYKYGMEEAIALAFEHRPCLRRAPLTVHEALNGIPGHPYANGVDPSKSASFPLNKAKLYCLEGDVGSYRFTADVQRDYDSMERRFHRGDVTGSVGTANLKDEPLPVGENGDIKDARVFFGTSVFNQVKANTLMGPIMHVMQEANDFFGNLVGVDPGSREWEYHEQRFDKCKTDRFLSLDQASYDLCHSDELKDANIEIFTTVARLIGYTDEEVDDVSRLMHEMEHPYMNMGGPIVYLPGLWPSGIGPTAIGGAAKTIVMLIAGYLEQFPDIKDIRKEIVFAALGDDNVSAEIEGCSVRLDAAKLSEFYFKSGMMATPDSKEGEIGFTDRADVAPLKRSTWYHPDLKRRVGRLAKKSITRPLVMIKKCPSIHQAMIDIVNSMAREAALWGKDYFDEIMNAHRTVFSENGWPFSDALEIDYETYIEIIAQRDAERVTRKWQDGDELVTDEQGVREIVEPAPIEEDTKEEATYRDPTVRREMTGDKMLPQYVYREVLVGTNSMTADTYFQSSFNPLTVLMETPGIESRFATYHALSFDLVVRFAITGTKYDYGEFIAGYMYTPSVLDIQDEKSRPIEHYIRLLSQRPHVRFSIGDDEVAELRIPFFYHHAMLPRVKRLMDDYVEVRLVSVTPPRSAVDDLPSAPSVTTYCRFDNIQVMGHTTATYQDVIPNEPKSKPSVILGRIARTSAMLGGMFPGVSTVAEAVAGAAGGISGIARALGYSAPMEVGGQPYVAFAAPPTANANMDQAGRVLSMDAHQGVAIHPNVGGCGSDDPLCISNIVSKEVIINTGFIPNNVVGVDNPWLVWNVTPAIGRQVLNQWWLSPSGMVSTFRRFWHGTMCYKVKLVTTGLTGGKLMLAYNANAREASPDTHTLENIVWDLKATHEQTIKIHWHQWRNWLSTWEEPSFDDPFTSNFDDGRHNGVVTLSTIQPIVGTKADQRIDFVITAWMENERFANPSYATMSEYRVFNLENIAPPSGPAIAPAEDGPGGVNPFDSSQVALNELFNFSDDLAGGAASRRPMSQAAGLFRTAGSTRRVRRIELENGLGLLESGSAGGPVTTPAPTPVPQTLVPTVLPTRVPSGAPSLTASTSVPTRLPTTSPPTSTPTRQPVLQTLFPSAAPSATPSVPVCSVYTQVVDPEFIGALDLVRTNGVWTTVGNTMSVRSMAYASDVDGAFIEVDTDVIPSSLPANTVATSTGFRITGAVGQILDSMNGNVVFPSPASVLEVRVSMPGGSQVTEFTPTRLASIYPGWVQGTEVVDGQAIDYVEVPQGTFVPPAQDIAPECGSNPFSFATFLYTGTLDGPGDSPRTATFRSRRWAGSNLIMEAVVPTRIYALYVVNRDGPSQQDGDVLEPDNSNVKEFGKLQDIHNDIVSLHMGEDLLSLRQDLKVFRDVAEFVVPPNTENSYQALLHASTSRLLGPYELLTASFAGIRGGMVAWYRLYGDGHAFIQRGQKYYTVSGELDPDLQRGFEYVDTRINPAIVVSYPWFSQARFEYGRWAFSGTEPNFRNVKAVNTGNDDLRVIESLRIKEDFDLVRFLGCPLLV